MLELAESTARFLGLETADLNRGAPILDFVKTAWLSVALLVVRVISERVCIPILASIIKDGPKRTVSRQVFDDSFIAFFSALLEALAVVNTVLYNGGECSDTECHKTLTADSPERMHAPCGHAWGYYLTVLHNRATRSAGWQPYNRFVCTPQAMPPVLPSWQDARRGQRTLA